MSSSTATAKYLSLDDVQKYDLLKEFKEAVTTKNHFQMKRLLRTYDLPTDPFDGFSPLFTVVYNFHVEGLRVLIEHHVDLQEKDENNNTVWEHIKVMKGGRDKEKENIIMLLAPHFGNHGFPVDQLGSKVKEAMKNCINFASTKNVAIIQWKTTGVAGAATNKISEIKAMFDSKSTASKQKKLTDVSPPSEQELLSGQQQTIIQTLEAFSKAVRLCDYEQVKASLNSLKRQYFDHDHPDGDWQISYLYMILAEFSYFHFDTDVRCEIFSFIKELLMLNMRVRDASIFDKHKDLFQKVLDKLKLPPEHPDKDSEEFQFKESFIRHHRNVITSLIDFQTIKSNRFNGTYKKQEAVKKLIKDLVIALNDPKDKGVGFLNVEFKLVFTSFCDIGFPTSNSHLLCVEFFKYIVQKSSQYDQALSIIENASATLFELKNDMENLHKSLRGVLDFWGMLIEQNPKSTQRFLSFLDEIESKIKGVALNKNLHMSIVKLAEIGLEMKSLDDPVLSTFGIKILNSGLFEIDDVNLKEKAKRLLASAGRSARRSITMLMPFSKNPDPPTNTEQRRSSQVRKKSVSSKTLTSMSSASFQSVSAPQFDNSDWTELCSQLMGKAQIANSRALSSISSMFKSGKSNDEIMAYIKVSILPTLLQDIDEFSKSRMDIPRDIWIALFCNFLIDKAQISVKNDNNSNNKEKKLIDIDDKDIKLSFKSEGIELYKKIVDPNTNIKEKNADVADLGIFWVDKSDPLGLTKLAKDIIENARAQKNVDLTADQSIECILSYIESGNAAAKKAKGQSLLMLVGGTGTGKSTTINWLSGCKMVKKPHPESKIKKIIEAENPVAKIGHSTVSDTFLPSIYPTDKITLCDTPGTGDNRGPEVDIANAVNIRRFLTSAGDLRFLILISYTMLLEKRMNGLKVYVSGLLKTFGEAESFKKHLKSMLFAVTQMQVGFASDDIEGVKEELKSFFKSEFNIDIDEEQVVIIEPLEESKLCLNRAQFLDKALSLSKIEEGKEQFSQSNLDERGELLLRNIVEMMERKIVESWGDGQFKKVAQEYKKLELLRAIGNKKIDDCLLETRAKIQKHVAEVVNHIKIILKSRDPNERRMLKQTFEKFKEASSLDICFDQSIVSKKVNEVEQFVKEEEITEQNEIDNVIRNETEIICKRLEGDLDKLRVKSTEIIQQVDMKNDILSQLLGRKDIASPREYSMLFREIENEIQLRPYKYCFPNIDDLERIKHQCEEKVKKLCDDAITTFIFDSHQENFEAHYNKVIVSKSVLIEMHQDQLYNKQIDFLKLKDYGFDRESIDEMFAIYNNVKELKDSKGEIANDLFKHFENLISNLMKDIHMKAKETKTATLVKNIQKDLKEYNSRERDHPKLKASLKLLSEISTPASAYDDVCNEMYNVLIKKQELERDRVIMATDQSYVEDITRLRAHAESLKQLDPYIPKETSTCFIQNLDNAIKKSELIRYNQLCEGIQNSFNVYFAQMQLVIDEILATNPDGLNTLKFDGNDLLPLLRELTNKIEKSRSYLEVFERTKEILDTWNKKFALTEAKLREGNNNKSESLATILKNEDIRVRKLFGNAINQSQISTLTQLIEDALKLLVDNIKSSVPVITKMLTVDNKFAQTIEGLTQFFRQDKIVKAFTNEQQIQGIHEQLGIIDDAKKEMKTLKANLDKLHEKIKPLLDDIKRELDFTAKELIAKQNKLKVDEITTKITNILVAGKIAENVDAFPLFYDELLKISEEQYQASLLTFDKALAAYKDPIKVNEYLSLGSYEQVTSVFATVRGLQKSMARHMKIDDSDVIKAIGSYIKEQSKAAIAQVHVDPSSDRYLDIDKVERVTNIIYTLHNYKLLTVPEDYLKDIHHAVSASLEKINWCTGLSFSSSQAEKKQVLLVFCKRLCKYFAIYRSLRMLDIYKAYIKDQFEKIEKLEVFDQTTKALLYTPIEGISNKLTELQNDKVMGAIIQEIIDTIPQFKKLKIKMYKKKITVDFNEALIKVRGEGSYGINRERLREIYNHYKTYYDDLVTHILSGSYNPEQIKSEVRKNIEVLKKQFDSSGSLYLKPVELGKVIAAISTQWSYLSSAKSFQKGDKDTLFEIHDTQVLGILRLVGADNSGKIKNHLAEILTGEGKSVALGMTATLFALLGYDVDVVCYSSYLSQRDYNMFMVLFDDFDVLNNVRYMKISELISSFFGKYIPSPYQALTAIMKGVASSHANRKKGKNLLLIDEVDVFFGENFYGEIYSCVDSLYYNDQEKMFEYIWKNKSKLNNADFIDEVKEQSFIKDMIKVFPNLKEFIDNKLREVVDDAEYIAKGGTLPDSYVIQDNKIGSKNHMLGEVVFNTICGYRTSFAYLNYCEKGIMKRDGSNDDLYFSFFFRNCYFLYSEIPNFYDLKLGMTGTLSTLSNSEEKVLSKYNFTEKTYVPSAFERKVVQVDETQIIAGDRNEEYFDAIKIEIVKCITNSRCAIVVFEDQQRLEGFKATLKKKPSEAIKIIEELTEETPIHIRDSIISKSIAQGKVIFITAIFGRGTDFVCRDSGLVHAGGVQVILTFCPRMDAEEIQIKGRTGRQDNPGRFKKIIYAGDLVDRRLLGRNSNGAPNVIECGESGTERDEYLRSKREALDEEKFQRMERNLEENKKKHEKSLEMYKCAQDGKFTRAIEILKEFQ